MKNISSLIFIAKNTFCCSQPYAIYLKVATLKQMNKCPKDYICVFIEFMFKKTIT